ncbi:sulfatase [Candidatus Hydrogenedentota bacterium]
MIYRQIMVLLALSCVMIGSNEVTAEQPNFVILFADDLGYGDLGCYGHPTIRTPRLDRMADEGTRFTQFYSTAGSCTPSRVSLLTGRYQTRSGVNRVLFPRDRVGIPKSEITLAEALKEKGYTSAAIGKWHLGHLRPFMPLQNGFDYYYGIPYSNDMNPAILYKNNKVIETPAVQASLTERYTKEAVKFIDRAVDKPFFLYLAYTMPHIPLHATEKFRGTSSRGLYGDVLETIDWSVGTILDHLKGKGLDEKTLVVFTSDNGPWTIKRLDGGSAGLLRGSKGTAWEGGVREPFIARWPSRIPAGQISQEVGVTMDLFTTFCKLAGADVPSDRPIDGKDLFPALAGTGKSPHDMLVFFRGNTKVSAVRKGPWKLMKFYRDKTRPKEKQFVDTPELYHLLKDPSESVDMSQDYPEIVAEIEKELEHFLKAFEFGKADKAPPGMLEEWAKENPAFSPEVFKSYARVRKYGAPPRKKAPQKK